MNSSGVSVPARAKSVRVFAVVVAVGLMYFPGLGVVDLASAALGLPDRDEYVSMRSGYGLVVGFLLPVALFTLARRPTLAAAPVQHVLAAAVAYFAAAAAGGVWTAIIGGVALLVSALVLARLAPGAGHLRPAANPAHRPLVVLAALGAGPWVVYAGVMAVQQRMGSDPYEDFTLGVQGWSALTVFALVMMLNSVIAVFRPPGWRSMLRATGIASLMFGLVSVWVGAVPGSPGPFWGGGALLWGIALIVFSWIPRRKTAPAGTSPTQ